jgi:hypothetical protein
VSNIANNDSSALPSEFPTEALSSRSEHSMDPTQRRAGHPSNERHTPSASVVQHSKEAHLASKDATDRSSHGLCSHIESRYPSSTAKGPQQVRTPYSTTPGSTAQDIQGLELHVRNQDYRPPGYDWLASSRQLVCPSHGPTMQLSVSAGSTGNGLTPMDRFLSEDSSQQYAMYKRADSGETSMRKPCYCSRPAGKKQGYKSWKASKG